MNFLAMDKISIGIKIAQSPGQEFDAGLISPIKEASGKKVLFPSESRLVHENKKGEWQIELWEKDKQNPFQLELLASSSSSDG